MSSIIKKLELEVDKKKISLTPEQAKKLKAALDELFGEKIVKEEHHHHHDYSRPYWYWYYDSPRVTYYCSGAYTNGNYSLSTTAVTGSTITAGYDNASESLTITI